MSTDRQLPAEVERYIRVVYGPADDNDRADWARRTADALLAGREPDEPMPRARTRGVSDGRIAGLRAVVARTVQSGGTA